MKNKFYKIDLFRITIKCAIKRTLIYIFLIIYSVSVLGCSVISTVPLRETEKKKSVVLTNNELYRDENDKVIEGNTTSNILNDGLFVSKGKWVLGSINFKLYKFDRLNNNYIKLSDDYSTCLNVKNDWLYYINNNPGNYKIYRVKLDGSSKHKVSEEITRKLFILGEKIYFSSIVFSESEHEPKEYKTSLIIKVMSLNGSGIKTIIKEEVNGWRPNIDGFFSVKNNWVYYISITDDGRLYRINLDKNIKQKVSSIVMQNELYNGNFIIENNCIYFINPRDSELYKMTISGTSLQRVGNQSIDEFNIANGVIYYSNSNGLFKMKTDGTMNRLLSNKNVHKLNYANGWIYCKDLHQESISYRIRTTGTPQTLQL